MANKKDSIKITMKIEDKAHRTLQITRATLGEKTFSDTIIAVCEFVLKHHNKIKG